MNRDQLADFLRHRRARVRPGDVGLPEGGRRRTPGLRRQEVAQLAGMSIEYYIRLEQARGPRPSRQVLSALSRALLLSIDERAHLFHLAGQTPGPQSILSRDVPDAIRYLIDSLVDVPAYVVAANFDILAWNDLATAFIGDLSGYPEHERNVLRWIFLNPRTERYTDEKRGHTDEDHRRFVRSSVADLRAAYGRYPDDPSVRGLVEDLLRGSPEFGLLWSEHEVEKRRGLHKTMHHPEYGEVRLQCLALPVPDRDQRIIMYVAAPGTPAFDAMRRIRADLEAARNA